MPFTRHTPQQEPVRQPLQRSAQCHVGAGGGALQEPLCKVSHNLELLIGLDRAWGKVFADLLRDLVGNIEDVRIGAEGILVRIASATRSSSAAMTKAMPSTLRRSLIASSVSMTVSPSIGQGHRPESRLDGHG